MKKNDKVLQKLDEIYSRLDSLIAESPRGNDLDDEIDRTALRLESLLIEKCQRDGVSHLTATTGPLHFVAGPN